MPGSQPLTGDSKRLGEGLNAFAQSEPRVLGGYMEARSWSPLQTLRALVGMAAKRGAGAGYNNTLRPPIQTVLLLDFLQQSRRSLPSLLGG